MSKILHCKKKELLRFRRRPDLNACGMLFSKAKAGNESNFTQEMMPDE